MAERGERADAVELAERRAARLEERLGRDHQNAHGSVIFARNRSTVSLPLSLNVRGTTRIVSARAATCCWRVKLVGQRRPAGRAVLADRCRPPVGDARARRRCRGCSSRCVIYVVNVLASTWRWHLLLDAQDVHVRRRVAARRRSWSRSSSTTSCRATSAATSSASATPRGRRGSKTLATTVVLVDRGARADGAGARRRARRDGGRPPASDRAAADLAGRGCGRDSSLGAAASAPAVFAPAGFGRLLQPLTVFHPGMGRRPHREAHRRAGALPRSARRARRLLRRRDLRAGDDGRVLLRRRATRCT